MNTHTLPIDADSSEEQLFEEEAAPSIIDSSLRHVALLAAWIATAGSLFMSQVLGWLPCVLCWYQRILMYPLAIILAVGILRRDQKLHQYVLPFSVAGIFTSLYHYLLIKTTWFPPPPCLDGIPCTTDYINWLGFINVPFLALTAFIIITFSMTAFAISRPDVQPLPQEDGSIPRFDTANLAVVMIIVAVFLTYAVGSTFI